MQARVIPSGSMENTVSIGDHLIVSRFGYDAGIPFTRCHVPLWRNPKRQQIIVFRAPLPEEGNPDFIKRCIGVPGDRIKIVAGQVYVDDVPLKEPYAIHYPDALSGPVENYPPSDIDEMGGLTTAVGAGFLEACRERRDRGTAERLFHDGRQPRQFPGQPFLGLRPARQYYWHASVHLHVH